MFFGCRLGIVLDYLGLAWLIALIDSLTSPALCSCSDLHAWHVLRWKEQILIKLAM